MQLGLSENLSSLVARRFVTARDAGHLIFSETHLTTVYAAGIPVRQSTTLPSRDEKIIWYT